MADHDAWDDDWDDDDQDVEPYVPETAPQATPAPAAPGPTAEIPAAPSYDDEAGPDDDGMLAPPPIEEFANQPAVARSRSRRTRARAVTQSGSAEIDPVPNAEPEPEAEPSRRSGCVGVTIVFVLVVAILAVMGWALVTMGPLSGLLGDDGDDEPLTVPEPQRTTALTSVTSTSQAPVVESAQDAADEECADSPDGTVAGNGPGSRDSGTDVILAFDHAYYVDRDGTAARKFMSEEITGTTAESLQEAIDELPEDTAHCLKISPKKDDKDVYLVDLIVFRNDGQELVRTEDEQTIYVEEVDGEYAIVGIINE